MMQITSKSNKIYKYVKSLLNKKDRVLSGCYTVEGVKSVSEALNFNAHVTMVAFTDERLKKSPELYQKALSSAADCFVFTDELFAAMSDTKTPSGVIAVIEMTKRSPEIKKGLYIYCDRITDPGNAGTIIRTADAAGASGVLFSPDSVDIYNPKVIRSTMGSFFHIPVWENCDEKIISDAALSGFCTVAGCLEKDSIDYMDADIKENSIIVIGNESFGVSKEILDLCCIKACIPIVGKAESLNASIAAALFMYRWLELNS